jgi:glycosyltransferase involved in cell wall biosynthesis
LRILMLAQFYPPSLGGEEQHVRNLAAGLAERGHEVSVATLRQPRQDSFSEDGAVRVYRLPGTVQRFSPLFSDDGHRFSPPLPDPETTRALRDVVRKERPEVVHAHNWIVHSFLPLKPWSGARLALTLHDYSLVCSQKRLMFKGEPCDGPALLKCLECASHHYGPLKGLSTAMAVRVMRPIEVAAVDFFLSVSSAVAQGSGLRELGVQHEVIPNFVPDNVASRRNADERLLAELPDGPFMLYVGDLSRDKGVLVLLDAYRKLEDPLPLVLIGKPRAETPRSWPSGVKALQSLPHAAVMEAWHRATIGLVPSVWPDPCPTVAMEAMSTGLPVIAAASGGLVDIVADGRSGLLVPPADAEALAGAMQTLMRDEEMRQRLGRQAVIDVQAFQAGTVIPRIEQTYSRLLGQEPAVAVESLA